MESLISHSEEDTIKIGERLAQKLGSGNVVALYGEFGAGKTVLAKGIAKALKCVETVKSPSFVFMRKYEGEISIYHIDLYRVKSPEDIVAMGLTEFFYEDGICIIEWAEKAGKELPLERIDIKIEIIDEKTRKFDINSTIIYYGDLFKSQ